MDDEIWQQQQMHKGKFTMQSPSSDRLDPMRYFHMRMRPTPTWNSLLWGGGTKPSQRVKAEIPMPKVDKHKTEVSTKWLWETSLYNLPSLGTLLLKVFFFYCPVDSFSGCYKIFRYLGLCNILILCLLLSKLRLYSSQFILLKRGQIVIKAPWDLQFMRVGEIYI